MPNAMASTICRVLGHRRVRTRVWHDGVDYRASCARCSTPLVRDVDGGWRPFDGDRDAPPGSQARSGRPQPHES